MIIGVEHPAYFYTATILNWNYLLKNDQYKRFITDSLKFMVEDKRIYVYGFTIMPNHIHLCMSIREGHELSDIKNSFMKFTAQRMKLDMLHSNDPALENFISTQRDRKYQIWERNALAIPIYSREVMEQKLNYIHNNAIQEKWRLAEFPEQYFFSSAAFYYLNKDDWGFITHYMEHM
ncbi:MAG TPA: transposase [Chitinophagales bacterium]|nr:transposase [Chitinophagales bacterium]